VVIQLKNSLIENQYLTNTDSSIFTMLLNDVDPHRFLNYSKRYFIHGMIKYPIWEPDIDIFKYLIPESLEMLKKNLAYFIFDASTEGFSPLYREPFFDILYYNCEKYQVEVDSIIFVSANLRDDDNIVQYSLSKNKKPIKVFCFPSFEHVVGNEELKTPECLLDDEKKYSNEQYNFKYFSSLSRVNRPYRTAATFILCQDIISHHALISHDKFDNKINVDGWKYFNYLCGYSNDEIQKWIDKLPLIVDREDFKTNWAIDTPFSDIHRQTIFQIVNETLVGDQNSTSLFYSEKTFRPISHFQPFVIFGQREANHYLEKLGYKLYDDWFDLSFDYIDDPIQRYKGLLNSIKNSCDSFRNLQRSEHVKWRFKNEDILLHNYKIMIEHLFSKNKLKNFLNKLCI
jgi:hypothetical protein